MGKYKICVYAICKNEEKFVDRWMASVKEADVVVVADTGSEDASVSKLREAGALVFEVKIEPWRFDAARNAALAHTPEDADVCVSVDLDEVFEPGWRSKLDNAWNPSFTRAQYLFTWSYKPDGSPDKQFMMEKIHRRHGFRWIHPVHEVLEYTGDIPDRSIWVDGLVLHHYPDHTKPRAQYLPLLELSARENPHDDRTVFWLGREYLFHRRYDDCIQTLRNHLLMPSAKWAEERGASMRFIAAAHEAKGDITEAKAWLFRSLAECPQVREPYMMLARIGRDCENWPLAYAMAKNGLGVTVKSGSYLLEPECWGGALEALEAVSLARLGMEEHTYASSGVKGTDHG